MRLILTGILTLGLLSACSEERSDDCVGANCTVRTDASVDGGTGTDVGADAGNDAGGDAGLGDANGNDGGPNDLGVRPDATLPDTGLGVAIVDFPPQRSLTDAIRTTIVGHTEASSGVTNVNIGGRAASSTDGFRTFRAEVDLAPGQNRIPVQTSGAGPGGSFVTPEAFVVEIQRDEVLLLSPRDVALDDQNGRIFVTDASLAQLLTVEVATGVRRKISGQEQGGGRAFVEPWGLALDLAGNRALVIDRSSEVLFAVDLSSGDRTPISDETSTGVALEDPVGVALDAGRNRALVVDAGLDAVVAIDLASGARTVLSDATLGQGPPMSAPRAIRLDAPNNRAYVADSSASALYIIELASGDRTVSVGTGPFFIEPWGVELDLGANRVFVGDSGQKSVFAIDLTTGARTVVADLVTGTGDLSDARSLVRTRAGTLYVLDSIQDAVLELDPLTGNRSKIADSNNGVGPHFGGSFGVACHPTDPTAPILVSDIFLESIFSVDPRQGDRQVLTGPGGRGPVLDQPYALTYDVAGNRALVSDPVIDAIVAVDLSNGMRSLVSNEVTGTGAPLNGPRGLVVLPNGRALITDSGANSVVTVDLTTGDRVVLSSSAVGTGPSFEEPWGITLGEGAAFVIDSALGEVVRLDLSTGDRTQVPTGTPILVDPRSITHDGNALYVADFGGARIVRVNTTNGDRVVISDATVGRGPRFVAPTGVAAHPAGYLVVVDERDVAYAVEKISGDRVFLSK
ncbi:MAG: hypothetical protein IPG45_08085 [Deltaproteobacteria bacterium]|nr:hypothetical protein [Deltaproteobacteria bacterium]